MKLIKLVSILILLLITFHQNVFAQADDVIAIKHELYKWKDAFNQKDLQNTLSVYAENYIGYYPGSATLDIKVIKEQFEKFFNNKYLKVTLSLEINEVQKSGSLAYTTINLIWAFLPSVSNSPQNAFEKGIQIWEKQANGKWQITRSSIYPYSEKRAAR
jgi:ketosteroid isomerase-like protein